MDITRRGLRVIGKINTGPNRSPTPERFNEDAVCAAVSTRTTHPVHGSNFTGDVDESIGN